MNHKRIHAAPRRGGTQRSASRRRGLASIGTTLIVAAALASSGCAASTTASTATDDSKKPAAASAPKQETAAVPRLLGLTRDEASDALRSAGLAIGSVTRQPSGKAPGTVIDQETAAGGSLDAGSSVALVIAAPFPKVPDVVGDGKASAVSQVKGSGFTVRVSTKTTTSGADNVVLSQSPNGGTRLKPGGVVELVVADLHKPVTLSSAGSSNCTPGYSPCLPPASDYDCEGGSGDGPKYTGLVHVTGSDPYQLDVDGDGIGCDR